LDILTNRVKSAVNVLVVLESSFIGLPVMPVSNTAELLEVATLYKVIPASIAILGNGIGIQALIDCAVVHLLFL
jgi:hypothetical protein